MQDKNFMVYLRWVNDEAYDENGNPFDFEWSEYKSNFDEFFPYYTQLGIVIEFLGHRNECDLNSPRFDYYHRMNRYKGVNRGCCHHKMVNVNDGTVVDAKCNMW